MNLLITGANRGLGLALAAESVKRGHTVFAGIRNPEERIQSLHELLAQYPNQVNILPLDVVNESSILKAVEGLKSKQIRLDVIINNAAILVERDKKIEEIDMDEVHRSFDVNVYGPMRVVKHFLPLLAKNRQSSIINISSEAGSFVNAYGGDYPYALSKHTLNMFTQQLRQYLKETGTQVFSIHPGWIRTDMGGEKAPGSPYKTAKGILDVIERKQIIPSDVSFINSSGDPMPF